MTDAQTFDVTISLVVTDRSALYRAGLAKARQDGLTRFEWREMRRDPSHPSPVHADLTMLLDPGGRSGFASAAGFEVAETTVTEREEG